MLPLLYLLFFAGIAKGSLPIGLCNDTTYDADITRLCKNTEDYDESQPAKPWPNQVQQIVTIYDIPELHQDLRFITLFVKLHIKWNDTRISLVGSENIGL